MKSKKRSKARKIDYVSMYDLITWTREQLAKEVKDAAERAFLDGIAEGSSKAYAHVTRQGMLDGQMAARKDLAAVVEKIRDESAMTSEFKAAVYRWLRASPPL